LNSPFDYANQALLYLPALTCQPSDESYLSEIVDYAIPLLKLTEGRAFFLFTSHRALKEAAILLDKKLEYPLLIQGDAPKSQLLASFCSMDNAILLGTSSFWEGVDVKGSRLSCVIIDKIPFLVPDDPILKARVDYYRKQNKNPFIEYQLPHAVITLRQGAGRLIRDLKDCGVLMLCDPRLMSKEYGKIVMASLPTMPITHHLEDVADFMESIKR
jgi:ATP-dependent DNA helicase DinG